MAEKENQKKAFTSAPASLLAQVIDEHGDTLRRLLVAYERDPGLREDLYQEVCLALWRALSRFRGDASLRTFALRIAHNRGVTHAVLQSRRRRYREQLAAAREADLVSKEGGPEARVLRREQQSSLEAALRELPIGLRQAVVLRLEGLSHREIADVLGASENAVTIRLSRARARLESALTQAGMAEQTWRRGRSVVDRGERHRVEEES